MFQIILELSQKYNKLEEKMNELSRKDIQELKILDTQNEQLRLMKQIQDSKSRDSIELQNNEGEIIYWKDDD
jgi:hypothetical protein